MNGLLGQARAHLQRYKYNVRCQHTHTRSAATCTSGQGVDVHMCLFACVAGRPVCVRDASCSLPPRNQNLAGWVSAPKPDVTKGDQLSAMGRDTAPPTHAHQPYINLPVPIHFPFPLVGRAFARDAESGCPTWHSHEMEGPAGKSGAWDPPRALLPAALPWLLWHNFLPCTHTQLTPRQSQLPVARVRSAHRRAGGTATRELITLW